jgi:predicted transcriptional regulator
MTRETIDGTPVTLEQIDEWAAEAEAGYPNEKLRKRGRQPMGDGPAPVIPVRMESSMLEALMERALKEDLTRSEAIREAIRAWLSAA